MPIYFQCGGCGARMRVKDDRAGRQVKCPRCGQVNTVPVADLPESEEPANEALTLLKRFAAWGWGAVCTAASFTFDKYKGWRGRRTAAKAAAEQKPSEARVSWDREAPPQPEPSVEELQDDQGETVEELTEAPESPPYKPCPFCGETIRAVAIKCRFCGEFLGRPLPGVGTGGLRGGAPGVQTLEEKEWKGPHYRDAVTWPWSVLKWLVTLSVVLLILMCAYYKYQHKSWPTSIDDLKSMFSESRDVLQKELHERLPEDISEKLGIERPSAQTGPAGAIETRPSRREQTRTAETRRAPRSRPRPGALFDE